MKEEILAFLSWVEDKKGFQLMELDYNMLEGMDAIPAQPYQINDFIDQFVREQEGG